MFSSMFNAFRKKPEKKSTPIDSSIKITAELVVPTETKKYDKKKLQATLDNQINIRQEPNIYQTNAICPNCNTNLDKKPARKAKCKSCKEYIIVRTHYKTKEKILLKESQIEEYERKASIFYKKNDIKRNLLSHYTNELDKDINLKEYLNKNILKSRREWKWGLYTITIKTLGDIDFLEDNKLDALKKYLEVIYYNVNNPSNVGKYAIENNLTNKYPPFKPFDTRAVSGYWIDFILELSNDLSITDIKKVFIEHNNIKYKELKVIPHKPEVIWNKIEDKFEIDEDK